VSQINELIEKLDSCPMGSNGWHEFENVCIEILNYLFVPPLIGPKIQPRTYSGVSRRDAVFPIREYSTEKSYSWKQLSRELKARMLLFEFKNYDSTEIGSEEVNQISCYMRKPMGNLSILVCSKKPNSQAHIRRNSIYSEESKVILFLEKNDLKEMLFIKEREEDPADLLVDKVESFYLQHE
jgi:hypothetical protein